MEKEQSGNSQQDSSKILSETQGKDFAENKKFVQHNDETVKFTLNGEEFIINIIKLLKEPTVQDLGYSMSSYYFEQLKDMPMHYAYYSSLLCKATEIVEKLKCNYNQWLICNKQSVDSKRYLTDKAKEDAAIAMDMAGYNKQQKEIIDAIYTQSILRGIVHALEIKQTIILALQKAAI